MTAMRLLFGIRTTGAVCLTVTANGQLPQLPPDLRIKTSQQDTAIRCSNNTWTATLGAGDHVVYLPADGDSWFDAPLAFTLDVPATIVSRATRSGPLQSWTATTGATGKVDAADDAKNPWPPPLNVNVDTAPLADSTWLSSTLETMSSQVTTTRSASSQVPPASAREPGGSR